MSGGIGGLGTCMSGGIWRLRTCISGGIEGLRTCMSGGIGGLRTCMSGGLGGYEETESVWKLILFIVQWSRMNFYDINQSINDISIKNVAKKV